MKRRWGWYVLVAAWFFITVTTESSFGAVAGDLRVYSTHYAIGVEWDVSDDTNHNATCTVQYRLAGDISAPWREGLELYRVDFKEYDMLAGSIMYLEPGRRYSLKMHLFDPDGGSFQKEVEVATRTIPTLPVGGRILHVVPGDGGGSGTASDPFRGIEAAEQAVQAGDTVILGSGLYDGEVQFDVSGKPDEHIVWKGAASGGAVIETIRVNADHLWFENLEVTGHTYGLRTYDDPKDIVVVRNRFTDCHYCIYLNHGGTGWYIADNVIIGDVDPASGTFSGEGVELNKSDDHTVMNNSISMVADGISYPRRNCDIIGNDIFDVSDDGIEPDYGTVNNRIVGNRISNAYHNGISFQPMNGAPWYVIRNQVAAPVESGLKFRDSVDRALIAHNTFVGWRGAQKSGSSFLVAVQSNNNLYISMTPWYAWENGSGNGADWRTNLDYDGFDWSGHIYGFKWGERYSDLASFSQATGLEKHGVEVTKEDCFTSLNIPASPPASMPLQHLTLKSTCQGIDRGVVLPNINDDYRGAAPDLGAYERGASLPQYGPRAEITTPPPPSLNATVIPQISPLLLEKR